MRTLVDEESALVFLQRKAGRDRAEELARRGAVLVQVDPEECDWPGCEGWHMEPTIEMYPPNGPSVPISKLMEAWR
jgi:hypothetical protein